MTPISGSRVALHAGNHTDLPLEGEREGVSDKAQSRNGRPGRRWLVRLVPLVFAAALVGAVVLGLWQAANPPKSEAPQAIGTYGLTQLVTGQAAVAQMSKLHGKGVGVLDGYIAHYEGPKGGAIAYVATTASEKDAADLLGQMEGRIAAGNQYFAGLKPVSVEGFRVLSVRSGQESHYFWATGEKVIWVAFDRDDPPALAAAVKVIS